MDVGRLAVFALWGLLSTFVWGAVLTDAWGDWRQYKDRRSKRQLLRDGALFVTAAGSTLAVLGVLLGEAGTTPRGLALAAALGTFLAAGIVSLSLRRGTDDE